MNISLLSIAVLVLLAPLSSRADSNTLPPGFSKEGMLETVKFLAGDELKGRGLGAGELDLAAEYIARKFKEAGLKPAGDNGSWFQTWEEAFTENPPPSPFSKGGVYDRPPSAKGSNPPSPPFDKGGMGGLLLKNVIAVLPGSKPEFAGQSVVIGAHYDHLGMGSIGALKENRGKIHPGADDNASGVAVLLELARVLGRNMKPDRTVVFAAFTGEEAGKLGSKHFVKHEKRYPAEKCIGMVNLDTVGRLEKMKLLVLGAGSAREWAHIFRGAGFVAGVEIEMVSEDLDSSDQKSFQEAGVPAVQLFSGPHLDYHRPTDTADRIDPDGLVKVASVAREVIEYLAGREASLTAAGKPVEKSDAGPTKERKVRLGTIPDFAYKGEGVRLSGVVPGSPAESAGLKEGDVIIRIIAAPVKSLKDLSEILRTLTAGERISITFMREGKEMKVETEVKER
jgi:hypothetical protein